MASSPISPDASRHRRRRRRKAPLFPRLLPVILILAVAGLGWLWVSNRRPSHASDLPGYVSSTEVLRQEYGQYTGKKLSDVRIVQNFDYATAMMRAGDFHGAVAQLETATKDAPLPVVFNNLGVLYTKLADRARAVNSFREALSRDASYRPVRENMDRLKGFTANEADPVSAEIEPNGTLRSANLIAPGRSVEAEIASNIDDVDWYRVATPPAPRDIVLVEVTNRSTTLIPGLNVYDADGRLIQGNSSATQPGQSVVDRLSPAPNIILHLEVFGSGHTAGRYVLTVRPQHAFDAYEPNDDLYSASKIEVGRTIDANIMDDEDTDYYSFVSPRTGQVEIDLQNRSPNLVPGVATYSSDMNQTGFGPDVNDAGGSLKHTFKVEKGGTYFVQVYSRASTAGAYSLTIR
jgi:hypothetical protein